MSGILEFTQSFFEASSKAWKKNKVKYDQACYKYKKNAFPRDTDMPVAPTQTRASQQRTLQELAKRQQIDEAAPLRERRSARLRDIHNAETYAS